MRRLACPACGGACENREKERAQKPAAHDAEHGPARPRQEQYERVEYDDAAVEECGKHPVACGSILPCASPQKRGEEDVEEHVGGEEDGIAERRVDARRRGKSGVHARDTEHLQKPVESDECRGDERDLPETPPELFGVQDRYGDEKVREEMRLRDPPVHALIVAPETFERVYALRVRDGDDDEKDGECGQKPVAARTVRGVRERKREVGARDDLDDDAEREILAGDEGKEERTPDKKDDERERKDAGENHPPERLFKCHGRYCTP